MDIIKRFSIFLLSFLLFFMFVGCKTDSNNSLFEKGGYSSESDTQTGEAQTDSNADKKDGNADKNNTENLPDNYEIVTDADDSIDSGQLDGESSDESQTSSFVNKENQTNTSQPENDREISYENNSGWSNTWN